jgi:gamma-glutamyltranspeptidase/glutathione hydrolase
VVHSGSSQPTGEVMTDGGIVYLETGFAWESVRELEHRGHRIGTTVGGYGGYQAVMWDQDSGVFVGASESRKDGHAAGY